MVGRDVDEGGVTGLEQVMGGQVDGLRCAGGDEDVGARGGPRIGQAQAVDDELDQWRRASRVAVAEQVAAVAVEDAVGGGPQLPEGEQGRVRMAPGQVNDAWGQPELGERRVLDGSEGTNPMRA